MFDDFVTLGEATNLLPKINGRKVSTCSVWRWAKRGIRGVRLETRAVGRRLVTRAAWLDEFAHRLAQLPPQTYQRRKPATTPRGRTPRQRARDIERARKTLAAR